MNEIIIRVNDSGQILGIEDDGASLLQFHSAALVLAIGYAVGVLEAFGPLVAKQAGGDFCAAFGKALDSYISEQEEH